MIAEFPTSKMRSMILVFMGVLIVGFSIQPALEFVIYKTLSALKLLNS